MSLKTKSFINFSMFVNLDLFFQLVLETAMAYLNDLLPSFLLFSGLLAHVLTFIHSGILKYVVTLFMLFSLLVTVFMLFFLLVNVFMLFS